MADDNSKIRELSIQARAKDETSMAITWTFNTFDYSLIAPWWSQQRDRDLRTFWMMEGNDILQGAISSLVKKFKAMSWVLEGPNSRTKERQDVLSNAEFGQGWAMMLSKVLLDYMTQDKGGFIELIGEGRPDGPMQGLPMALAHLDAQYCQLTGDVEYPVIFYSAKDGKPHKLHATRVAHLVDMPSPNEAMNGVGFCGVSRVIASSQVLLKLAQYKNEKLSDLPEAGMLLINNLAPHKWEDVKAEGLRGKRKLGQELWNNIIVLLGMDPASPITAEFLSFANLPDQFNELESTNLYVNIVALAFGVDPREFWPITEGRLGSGAETTVQHQKAKGKLVGELTSNIERIINWHVLPASVNFAFDFQDDEEDRTRAEINQLKIDSIMKMWVPSDTSPTPVTALEIRQMLADNTDYFLQDFLQVDITDEVELSDTEREAKMYGRRIMIDRYGREVKRKRVSQNDVTLLQIVESNYRQGLIDLDTLVNYRLGMVADEL